MRVKTLFYYAAILSIMLAGNTFAQIKGFDKVGTTSFQFLTVIPNAKAASLGGVCASTIQTSEAVFFNPAMLTRNSKLDVSLSYLDYFLDVKLTSFSLAFNISNIGAIGLQVVINDVGEFEETSADHLFRDDVTGVYNPGLTGNMVSPGSQVFGISYARDVTDKFSFGITAKYAREDLIVKTASAVIFDGGIVYRTGFKSLTLGTMLRNFGPEVKYFEESYPLPQTFTIGISGYLAAPENSFFYRLSNQRLLFAYDMAQTRDHSQQHHVGVEYEFHEFVFLRAGYKFNFDEESYTAGLGLEMNRFRINYSYNSFGDYLDALHRFTIGFKIQ